MPARKRKTWMGRVYLGRDENGKQQFYWVGRFDTKRERDDAVARARTERPWETAAEPDGMTCDEWADRMLDRMESGALRTSAGRRYKDSSIDTARSSLKAFRAEFGDRDPRLDHPRRGRGLGRQACRRRSCRSSVQLMNQTSTAPRRSTATASRASVPPTRPAAGDQRPPSEEEMVLLLDGC